MNQNQTNRNFEKRAAVVDKVDARLGSQVSEDAHGTARLRCRREGHALQTVIGRHAEARAGGRDGRACQCGVAVARARNDAASAGLARHGARLGACAHTVQQTDVAAVGARNDVLSVGARNVAVTRGGRLKHRGLGVARGRRRLEHNVQRAALVVEQALLDGTIGGRPARRRGVDVAAGHAQGATGAAVAHKHRKRIELLAERMGEGGREIIDIFIFFSLKCFRAKGGWKSRKQEIPHANAHAAMRRVVEGDVCVAVQGE